MWKTATKQKLYILLKSTWARNMSTGHSTDKFDSTYRYIRYGAVQSEITFPCHFINVQQGENVSKEALVMHQFVV
jgi:hypothetical protein